MNRSLLLLLALIAGTSIHAQTYFTRRVAGRGPMKPRSEYIQYTIKGSILNADNSKKLQLSGVINKEIKLNADNTFELEGEAYSPGIVIVQAENSNPCFFWVSNGAINLTLTEYTTPMRDSSRKYLKVVNLTGPPETEAHQLLMRRYDELQSDYKHLSLRGKIDSAAAVIYPEVADYISKNRSSYLSLNLVNRFSFTIEQKQALLAMVDPNVSPNLYNDQEERLKRSALLKPGTVFPDFKQKMPDGTGFNLYSVKAKYILLQFWDSECTDCRENNKSLLDLYAQYHPMGLEIVNVSLDTRKRAWKLAVAEDALPWKQVSDLKGTGNAIASAYKIDAAPFSVLLNHRYEVVAEAIFTPVIVSKIQQLFKQ